MKKTVSLKNLQSGEKLAQDVYTQSGTLLLSRGTAINQAIISRLLREGFESVQVEAEDVVEDLVEAAFPAGDGTDESTRGGKTLGVADNQEVKKNLEGTKYIAEEVTRGRPIPLEVAHDIVKDVYQQITDNKNIYVDLMNLRSKDNYTYEHSLGVCVIATTLYKNSVLSQEELFEVSLSALLHDIGKTKISDEIIRKPGPLTDQEFEIVKQHPVLGYQMVKDITNEDIAKGVLQHHEREDGTGYPQGVCSGGIHRYAKIINISDTFDAIVSDRAYRSKSTPIKAFEEINRTLEKFDYNIYVNFIKQFSQYYIGSLITLNTGHQGYIAQIDIESPGQPLVRVGEHIIDLKKLRGLFITDMAIQKKHVGGA